MTPEGIRNVINGLKQVQRQGSKANRESARGLNAVKRAAANLKKLLPTIGFAAVVTGIVAITRNAALAAEEMGQLAQITGTTAENLSIFRFQAERNKSTLEEQRVGLVTLAQNLERLREGNAAAAKSFADVTLEAEDFIGLDTVEAAFKIAKAIASIEEPARKTAIAKNLLGESGARLIPTLEDLAVKGFAGARAEAEKLGVVMSDQLVADVTAAQQALFDLQQQTKGLALTFVGELAPAITQAMSTVADETQGTGLSAVKAFARGVGAFLALIINAFRLLAQAVTSSFTVIFQTVGLTLAATGAAAAQAIRGNFSAAASIIREGFADIRRINREESKKILDDFNKLLHDIRLPPERAKPRTAAGDGGGVGIVADQGLIKVRLDAVRKRLDAELKLQQEKLKAEAEADERAFKVALISLDEFFDRRRARIERQAALEVTSLRAQRAAVAATIDETLVGPQAEAERLRKLIEIAQFDAQIRLRQLALARELAGIEGDRRDEMRSLADEQIQTANDLDELEGRRHAVFQRNLKQEIRDVQELGRRAGETAAEITATVDRLRSARTTRFDFDEVTRRGQEALEAFRRDSEQIQLAQQAGVIGQLEGERQLIELQRKRLGVLRELADAALKAAAATGDPDLIRRAQAYADSIAGIEASFQAATDSATRLKNAGIEAFEAGLADLLSNIQDIESLEDAFKSLARTVAQTMQRIAAEILAQQATLALLRAFGGGGGGGGGALHGGYVRGYAGGGDIAAPRLPLRGPDNIPILAQKGEFMMRRARVSEPGALAFLRAWNTGHFTLRQALTMPRFQTGGLVGPEAPAGGPVGTGRDGRNLRIINLLDPNLVTDALNSAAGEDAVLNIMDRNSERLSRLSGTR
jgi:hypothetical protein